MSCPSSLIAGSTWSWGIVDTDRSPADGWALEFRFVGVTNIALSVAVNAAGNGWTVTHSATASATVLAGRYEWFAIASKSDVVQPIARGSVTVEPNPLTATAIDSRSPSRIALENIEALIANRATSAQKLYEIAGRKLEHFPLTDLIAARDKFRQDVAREDACARAAAGLSDNRRILVSFR
jgi:hypothetical protein